MQTFLRCFDGRYFSTEGEIRRHLPVTEIHWIVVEFVRFVFFRLVSDGHVKNSAAAAATTATITALLPLHYWYNDDEELRAQRCDTKNQTPAARHPVVAV